MALRIIARWISRRAAVRCWRGGSMRESRLFAPAAGLIDARGGKPVGPDRSMMSGFLLIDLLVAMLLFAALSVSVSMASLASAHASRVSENQAIASALATEQLDIFKSQYRAGLPFACIPIIETSDLGKAGFVRECDFPDPDAPAFPAGLASARVRVSWTGSGAGSIALHTVMDVEE